MPRASCGSDNDPGRKFCEAVPWLECLAKSSAAIGVEAS
jgi:hypothetical protein